MFSMKSILKSFNSNISLVVCSFFEFVTISKWVDASPIVIKDCLLRFDSNNITWSAFNINLWSNAEEYPTYECHAFSSWLIYLVQPIRSRITFKSRKVLRISHGIFLRIELDKYGPRITITKGDKS